MSNFIATNSFKCPHCNEKLDGAMGFTPQDKPKHDDFTVCAFCAEVCVYVIEKGIISLRKPREEDDAVIKSDKALSDGLTWLQDFVKNKPKQ